MDLSKLSDQQLMFNAKALVQQESHLLIKILHHIKEIDNRRLYADYKQPGLLELVMKELGYPRDQALRRIQAMRMMRENPIVEEKIESGKLNLTTIGLVQTLFSHEKKAGKPLSAEEKASVINKVCGHSTREVQRLIFSMSSLPVKLNEKIKMIAPDLYELMAVIDEETNSMIEKLKGLLAHSHPNLSNGELLKMLSEIGLKELGRVKAVAAPRLDSKAEIKRKVWLRDQCKCSNCSSTFAVQEDHRWPKAKGGDYSISNIRLLCRSCNQRAAIKHFGVQKIKPFLNP